MKHKQPKGSNKKKQKGSKKDVPSSPSAQTALSVDELIEAGEAAAGAEQADKALEFFTCAESLLKRESSPESQQKLVFVLEKVGESNANMGDHEAAKQSFENAIQLLTSKNDNKKQPQKTAQYNETLASLYLYVGQLCADHEALAAFKKGLESLELSVDLRQTEYTELKQSQIRTMEDNAMEVDSSGIDEAKALLEDGRQKLSSARVTVADLYLTDLCFDDDAETECDSFVCLALKINDTDGEPMIDALQTATSLRLSQKRKAEATGFILRAYEKMRTGCEALAKLVGLDDSKSKRSAELEEVDAASGLPSFEFRCQTVKLLLECAALVMEDDSGDMLQQASWKSEEQDRIKCYNAAVQVLGSLLAENDEVPEVWYLLGCTYMDSGNKELARDYWSSALEMLTNFQKELEQLSEDTDMQDDDDDENEDLDMQIQSISCQMEEIRSKLEDIEEENDDNDEEDDNTAMKE